MHIPSLQQCMAMPMCPSSTWLCHAFPGARGLAAPTSASTRHAGELSRSGRALLTARHDLGTLCQRLHLIRNPVTCCRHTPSSNIRTSSIPKASKACRPLMPRPPAGHRGHLAAASTHLAATRRLALPQDLRPSARRSSKARAHSLPHAPSVQQELARLHFVHASYCGVLMAPTTWSSVLA